MEDTYRRAHQAGHARLYHYEKFRPEWLSTTLREQKIHCANPADLNDPWDCMPCYSTSSFESPEVIENFIIWLRSIAKERPRPPVEAKFENRLRTDPASRHKFVEGFSASNQFKIGQRRIYCLTPDACSTLMWSHYGDNHRGVCLEFHLGNNVFLNSLEVRYSSTYPTWAPHTMKDIALDMILTKSDEWAYEREFRIITSSDHPDGHPLKPDGDFLRLPPRALVGILVGCKGDHAEVARIVNEYAPGLPVKRIVRVPNHYRLTIEGQAGAPAA